MYARAVSELQEPTNHFTGAAEAYAKFREGYPDAVWALLAREVELDGSSEILELGCGPGTATIGLAARAASVTAVELDADMLAEGQRVAARADVTNVRWVRAAAEDFDDTPGRYALVVVASAFHWMDRTRVAIKSHALLRTRGALAVVDNPTPLMQIRAREGVGAAIAEVQDRWFAPKQYPLDLAALEPVQTVLAACGFAEVVELHVPCEQRWDVARFLGFLCSTSSRPDAHLGPRFERFAAELDQAIRAVEPSGRWALRSTVRVIVARR
jgi:SAM-dependent methyltransferase